MTPDQIADAQHRQDRQLWAAVIMQALDDATGAIEYFGGNKEAAERHKRLVRRRARDWFFYGGKDFKEVCALADMDPDWIRANALKKIEEAGADPISKRVRAGTIIHNGERITLKELSARTGISLSALHHRVKSGMTGDQLTAPSAERKCVQITFNGETRTANEWSEITGIKAGTIAHRLKSGWTIEEALTPGRRKPPAKMTERQKQAFRGAASVGPKAKRYTHDGKTLTVQQWSKITGVKAQAIHYRLRSGMTIAEALRPGSLKRLTPTASVRLYTHDGKTMSLYAWAKHLGIPRTTLRTRLDQLGWSIEQALTTPVKSNASVEKKAA